jgi:serine/threonine-protein kinase
MDAERWQRLSPLLDVLLELEPAARDEQLRILRDENPQLAAELEELLTLERQNTSFIAKPLLAGNNEPLQAGTMIGPYRLESPLGEGGMGTVWLAVCADGLYQRKVALKLLRPGLVSPNLRLRFDREREILARLEHPNVARLFDAGVASAGQPYLALEYVAGVPITEYCRNHALSVDARLKLFLQVCDAVSYAHANLIVHRDLKPSNILVTTAGEVRLLDFGIAKLLDASDSARTQGRTETRMFTLHYAAPEQVSGGLVTAMTDVYSLGVVLYELLTDAKPYRLRRQSDAEWEQAILNVEPLKPSVVSRRNVNTGSSSGADQTTLPTASTQTRRRARRLSGDLDNIVLKTLAKQPEQRYPSVEALAADLRRHLEGRPVQARTQNFGYRLHKYLSRQRWQLAMGGAITAMLLIALLISVRQTEQARRDARRAREMQDFVAGLFDNANGAQGARSFDVRQLLLDGERRSERELAKQPLAHAELLDVLVRLRTGLGDYPQALQLLERQQALLAGLTDASPALHVQAAIQHGHVLYLLDRSRDCVQRMVPLQAQAMHLRGQPLQQAAFYSQLGRCQLALGQRADVRLLFERSAALRRAADDGIGVAGSLYELALLDAYSGKPDSALRGYQKALAELGRHADAPPSLVVDILRSQAVALRARGDTDAALADYARALSIARESFGENHPVTLGLRRAELSVRLVDLGHYRQAEREIRPLHAQTLQALGPQHHETGMAWNTLGIVALALGHNDEAVDDLAHAVSVLRNSAGSQQLHGVLFNYGMALHAAGRDAEALQALREARELRVEQFGASHAVVGFTDRMIGEVLAAQGNENEAATYFERAFALTRIGYGAQSPGTLLAELSLARYYGRVGRMDDAKQMLTQVATQPGGGSELPKLRWQARAYLAELQCRNGETMQARHDLDALLAELHRERSDDDLIIGEVELIRTKCRQ